MPFRRRLLDLADNVHAGGDFAKGGEPLSIGMAFPSVIEVRLVSDANKEIGGGRVCAGTGHGQSAIHVFQSGLARPLQRDWGEPLRLPGWIRRSLDHLDLHWVVWLVAGFDSTVEPAAIVEPGVDVLEKVSGSRRGVSGVDFRLNHAGIRIDGNPDRCLGLAGHQGGGKQESAHDRDRIRDDGDCMLGDGNRGRCAAGVLLAGLAMLAGCGKTDQTEKKPVPDVYKVKFETTKGDFVIEVTKAWAPLGAERFYELVTSGFFDNSKFFRVVPGFVVQFGLAATPEMNRTAPGEIADDPVTQTNAKGTITFATRGPNSRTTQVFINLADNRGLDRQGFSPFGTVTEGMNAIEQLYSGYGDSGPNQGQIKAQGNAYVEASFPKLDGIKKATIL